MINSLNKTFLSTQTYQNRNWFIIDCTNQKLGRLATVITSLLKGKVKPDYSPSIDRGDYVILINANLLIKNKESQHYLVYNPGRPGHSLKIKKATNCSSAFNIKQAVKGMLSKTETKRLMRRLKIYDDQNHNHSAQNPIKLDVTSFASHSQFIDKIISLKE
jgi:large subunit ribosomal protein L13